MSTLLSKRLIVADAGGTHARFGIAVQNARGNHFQVQNSWNKTLFQLSLPKL